MAFDPANIKSEMPVLSWRQIEVPCVAAPITGQLVQAPRPYPYLDVDAHESVRRASETIEAELLFLNTVQANSFPDLFRQFYAAIVDKKIGELVHPARGFLFAKVLDYSIAYDAQDRAGCRMRVRWAETRKDASTSPAEIDVPPDAKEVARDADVAVEAVAVLYPTNENAPVGTDPAVVAKGEAFAAAYAAAFDDVALAYPTGNEPETILELYTATLGEVQANLISLSGKWARAANVVARVAEAIDAIDDPALWPASLVVRSSWRSMSDLATEFGEKDRQIGKYIVPRDMPLDEIAAGVGARVDDLVSLNPGAVSAPLVGRNTVVRYYLA